MKLKDSSEALERLVAYAEDLERCVRILGGEVVDAHKDMDFARSALAAVAPRAGA